MAHGFVGGFALPLDVSREGGLAELVDWIRRLAVGLDLRHESAATAIRRQTLALDECRDLRLRQFLPAKFVARIQQNLELVTIRRVPLAQCRVNPRRCTSAGRDVDDKHWLPSKFAHREFGLVDGLALERVQRGCGGIGCHRHCRKAQQRAATCHHHAPAVDCTHSQHSFDSWSVADGRPLEVRRLCP